MLIMADLTTFIKRAKDRLGLIINPADISKIENQIVDRKANFIKWSDSEGYRSFYKVRIYDEDYVVLYDFSLSALVSIYDKKFLKKMENYVNAHCMQRM